MKGGAVAELLATVFVGEASLGGIDVKLDRLFAFFVQCAPSVHVSFQSVIIYQNLF